MILRGLLIVTATPYRHHNIRHLTFAITYGICDSWILQVICVTCGKCCVTCVMMPSHMVYVTHKYYMSHITVLCDVYYTSDRAHRHMTFAITYGICDS